MNNTDLLKEAKDFLRINNTLFLATVSREAVPESALVYYFFDGERSVYFATPPNSKKIKNILENKNVALTLAKEQNQQELQLTAHAYVVKNQDDATAFLLALHKHIGKPNWPLFSLHPQDIVVIRVIIEQFKYSRFASNTSVIEGSFSDWI